MVALYVISSDKGSGKTTVCAGLGRHWLNGGRKVGFFKPVITGSEKPPGEGSDSDVTFIKHLFGLEESIDLLSPVFRNESQLRSQIKEAYARVSQGKDMVIIEGISDQGQAPGDIAAALDARVIIVKDYSQESLKATNHDKDFAGHLLGVVLNKVPRSRLETVPVELSSQPDQSGANILAILPEDRTLFAPTIGELADYIQGETVNGTEKMAELVENFMVGAMSIDPGPEYFGRKDNKVVVVRSERPDMQLAVLQTSTRGLVLAGNTTPIPAVIARAEEKSIPLILAGDNITTVMGNIEDALGKTRFNQENKLPRLAEIMEQHFDFQAVSKELGLD